MQTIQLFGIQEVSTGYWVTSAKVASLGDFSSDISIFTTRKSAEKAIWNMNTMITIDSIIEASTRKRFWDCRINHVYKTLLSRDVDFKIVPLNVSPQ
jgi:hypothetical protein